MRSATASTPSMSSDSPLTEELLTCPDPLKMARKSCAQAALCRILFAFVLYCAQQIGVYLGGQPCVKYSRPPASSEDCARASSFKCQG
jgi:hypothetical protein